MTHRKTKWPQVAHAASVVVTGALLVSCAKNDELLGRSNRPVPTFDSGTSLPEASTSGQTQAVVLEDGGVVQVQVLSDGGLALPDGGQLVLEGGLGGSVFNLRCDAGAITVSGAPKTVNCAVLYQDGSPVENVIWLAQDTLVGSIGTDGVFTANGWVGGIVEVSAKVGGATISTKITVDFILQQNPDGVPTADAQKMIAGGVADGTFRWLYPQNKTVFPRGLPAPLLQFDGGCGEATYLKITAPHFVYELTSKGTSPLRITVPEEVWKGLTLTAGASDWVDASVSKLCGGQATGPVSESWLVAPGKMKGVIYYTTYDSPTFGISGALRLELGSQAEVFRGDCTVCHSVSANGEVLAGAMYKASGSGRKTGTFDLTTGAVPPPQRIIVDDTQMFALPALTPDGKRALTYGVPNQGSTPQAMTTYLSQLVDTFTAQVIVPSANIPVKYAQTPSFSPDGKHIAFNNSDIGTGHLGIMDYDDSQSPPAFSNLRELTQHPSKILAWPSFLPDSQAVVYHEGGEFRSFAAAELRLVEVATGEVKTIGALNGYAEDGSFALPYGLSVDGQKNFMPTVLPRPIGGYYWVMFTSRRTYGNVLGPTTTTTRRKIWVAAIDIDHTTKADPSHPAFYLTGQEEQSGSLRPFASLDPCRQEGASCESGADCCAGFCRETGRDTSGTPILNCVPPPVSTCSNLDEACDTPADCCDTTLLCILGRCSLPTPIIQ